MNRVGITVIASAWAVLAAWSPSVQGAGDPTRGSTLYSTTYACTDCHTATPSAGQIANGSTGGDLLRVIQGVPEMRGRYLTTLGQNQTDLADIAAYIASVGTPAPGSPDLNQHGLTGSWFEPTTSGQGIEIEVFPNLVAQGTALVQGAWFTFDVAPAGGADRERWYTFSGSGQHGAANVAVTIYRNIGGNFDAVPVTQGSSVGTGTLTFADCSNATLAYAFTDGRSGSVTLTRLTPNVTCTVGTAPPTNADFALSGNWFDATTSGQGFVFDVNPLSPAMFLTWYTYAPAGHAQDATGQRWFVGLASYSGGARTVQLTLYETTGGAFDQVTNPAPVSLPVGSATVTFASCTSAQIQFNFTSGSSAGKAGMIALARVGPVPPGCGP